MAKMPFVEDDEESRPNESHLRPLAGRVGDWRAGLGRSLCSPLTRSFVLRVSQHLDLATFPAPATSNAADGFPVLNVAGHIYWGMWRRHLCGVRLR